MATLSFRYKTEPITIEDETRNYFCFCATGCLGENCSLYEGEVPEGFPFEVDIRCYYLLEVDGVKSIEYDETRATTLEEQDAIENEKNKHITREELTEEVESLETKDAELEAKIGDILDVNSEQETQIDDNSTRITAIELDMKGIEHNIYTGNNNLLFGTQMIDWNKWFANSLQSAYVESDTPPEYSTEWWFGGYWYCTESDGVYKKGTMYQYDTTTSSWVETSETRKTINDYISVIGTTMEETTFSKVNFSSGRQARLNGEGVRTTGLVQGVTPINNTIDKLTLSMKVQNGMTQGEFAVWVEFYDKYDLTQYLRAGSILPMYRAETVVRPDEATNLSLISMSMPIQTEKELLYGVNSEEAPTDITQYWIKTSTKQLYEYNGTEWVLSNKKNTVKVDNTYYASIRENPTDTWYYAIEKTDIEDYKTLCVSVHIEANYVAVNYVGEEEPTLQKGMYWGQESTDKIFRAVYNGDDFIEWKEIETSYTEAVTNGTEYGIEQPLVYPKGDIIIGDVKLEYGDYTLWTPNPYEVVRRNLNISDDGIEISKGQNKLYFNEDEFVVEKEDETIFSIIEDETYMKKSRTIESDIDGLITKKVIVNNKKMYVRYIR